MADELAAIVALSLEVEINGKRWKFSPLTIRQTAELRAWARNKPFEDFRARVKLAGDVLTKEERAELLAGAEAASKDDKAIGAYLDGPEGTAKAFEYMLRINHPDVTDAQLAALFQPEVEVKVWRWLAEVTAPAAREAEPKKDAGGGGK